MIMIRLTRFAASPFRCLIQSHVRSHASGKQGGDETSNAGEDKQTAEEITLQSTQILEGLGQNIVGSLRRPKAIDKKAEKDRRFPVSLDVSLRYMESKAYKQTYGDHLIWQLFRRNFGGQFFHIPFNVRVSCLGPDGFIKYGQACPICRDEYLVIHYKNVKLLKQFMNPHTATIYPPRKTSVCQKKNEELLVAIEKAKMFGTLSFYVPLREYDYRDYYLPEEIADLQIEPPADVQQQDPILQKALQDQEYGGHHEYAMENFP